MQSAKEQEELVCIMQTAALRRGGSGELLARASAVLESHPPWTLDNKGAGARACKRGARQESEGGLRAGAPVAIYYMCFVVKLHYVIVLCG